MKKFLETVNKKALKRYAKRHTRREKWQRDWPEQRITLTDDVQPEMATEIANMLGKRFPALDIEVKELAFRTRDGRLLGTWGVVAVFVAGQERLVQDADSWIERVLGR